MKVLVTDKINEAAASILKPVADVDILPTMSEDELCKVIGEYDALMIRSQTKVTPKIIEAAKNMKIIGRAGVGVDNIDLPSATQHGIIVVNSPDGNTHAAAEHTLAIMLSMSRNIPQAVKSTKEGLWERSKFVGTEVFGKTLGIIGFGKIGSHVAKVAIALGMKVVVCDPYSNKEVVEKLGATYISKFDDFWGMCDYITLHTPKTKETMHLVNKETISKMKKGVKLINCARGGIIDEQALSDALKNGQVSGCAIDVYEDEPKIELSPLLKVEGNVLLTPHLGASTKEAQFNVAIDVAEQIKDVLAGGSARSAVNIPSLKAEKLEPVKEYMQLAENIGEVVSQLAKEGFKSVEIDVDGYLSQVDISPIEVAVLKGIFSHQLDIVNFVNAPIVAKERGVETKVSKSNKNPQALGSISVKIKTDSDEFVATGGLIAKGIQRITQIDEYVTSIKAEEHMLIVPHENKPTMIAQVATAIGKHNININRMNVAQKSQPISKENDNISIMIINTDSAVDEATIKEISKIQGIKNAKYISIKGWYKLKNNMSTEIDEFEIEMADARRSYSLVLNKNLLIALTIFAIVIFALALPPSTWIGASKITNNKIDTTKEPIQIETTNFYNYDMRNLKKVKSVDGSITYYVMPLAQYSISGKLAVKNTFFPYGFGDFDKIAKIDLGLVWSDLAESEYFNKLGSDSRQTGAAREQLIYYKTPYSKEMQGKESWLVTKASHTHIIPANKKILFAVKTIRKGEIVKLDGYLVDVYDSNKNRIATTSLSRNDTGNGSRGGGSCEVMYVGRVQIGNKIFE